MGSRRLGACLLVLWVWFARLGLETLVPQGLNPAQLLKGYEGSLEKAGLECIIHRKMSNSPKLSKMAPRAGKGGKIQKKGKITGGGQKLMRAKKLKGFICVIRESASGKEICTGSLKGSPKEAFSSSWRKFVAHSPESDWDWNALESYLEKLHASPHTWQEWRKKQKIQGNIRRKFGKLKWLKLDRKPWVDDDVRQAYRAQKAFKIASNLLHLQFEPALGYKTIFQKAILEISRAKGLVAKVPDPSGFLRFLAFGDALGDFLDGENSPGTAVFSSLIHDAENDERGNKSRDMRTALQAIHHELVGFKNNFSLQPDDMSRTVLSLQEVQAVLAPSDADGVDPKLQLRVERQLNQKVKLRWYRHHFDWVYNFLGRCVKDLGLDVAIELIGSFATRTEVSTSDIDFQIVGEMDEDSIDRLGQCIKEGNATGAQKGKGQPTVKCPRIWAKHSQDTCKHGFMVSFGRKRGWNITVVKRAGKKCRRVDTYDLLLDTDEPEAYHRTLQCETRREAQIRDMEHFYENEALSRAVRWVRKIMESAGTKEPAVKSLKGILIRGLVWNISVTEGLEAENRDPTGVLIAEADYKQFQEWQSPQTLL